MIYIFDSNRIRAMKAKNNSADNVVLWYNGKWEETASGEVKEPSTEDFFVVHHNPVTDLKIFDSELKRLQSKGIDTSSIPVIYFTGSNPVGRPLDENWIRYRSFDAQNPFTFNELTALEEWVTRGMRNESKPWLFLEMKPSFLQGILMLLLYEEWLTSQEDNALLSLAKDCQMQKWWSDRFEKESGWKERLLQEAKCRFSTDKEGKRLVQNFVDWLTHVPNESTSDNEDKKLRRDLRTYLKRVLEL